MKNIIYIILAASLLVISSCTKWDYIDGGKADDKVQGTMLEYLGRDAYNWTFADSLIRRAGLEEIFSGKDANYKEITFFGPTNHSIRKWMFDNKVKTIKDISVEDCRKYIMSHVLNKRIMRDDIPRGNYSTQGASHIGTGGEVFTLEEGNKLWIHSFRQDYEEVPEAGAVVIRILALNKTLQTSVASSNIRCTNGVVHSLSYTYQFPKIF